MTNNDQLRLGAANREPHRPSMWPNVLPSLMPSPEDPSAPPGTLDALLRDKPDSPSEALGTKRYISLSARIRRITRFPHLDGLLHLLRLALSRPILLLLRFRHHPQSPREAMVKVPRAFGDICELIDCVHLLLQCVPIHLPTVLVYTQSFVFGAVPSPLNGRTCVTRTFIVPSLRVTFPVTTTKGSFNAWRYFS